MREAFQLLKTCKIAVLTHNTADFTRFGALIAVEPSVPTP
jgi:hypothetical protein